MSRRTQWFGEAALTVLVLIAAVAAALWAGAQPSSEPARRALAYLAVPTAALLLAGRRRQPFSTLVTVYAETLMVPLLLAGQLVRLGWTPELLPLLLGLQVAAVVVGRLARERG
jgi:hypothetical protein